MRRWTVWLVAAIVLSVPACRSEEPTAPDVPPPSAEARPAEAVREEPHVEQGDAAQASEEGVRQLLSAKRTERAHSLEKLNTEYIRRGRELMAVLEDAADKYRHDRTYYSPLHCAIMAVEAWHVLDADTRLLAIIDYQLDALSVPRGKMLLGEDFYPAVRALVRLRVDAKRVLQALGVCTDTEQLPLLVYVLSRRVGSVDEARAVLGNAGGTGGGREKQNFAKAMESLEHVKHSSDLLPPPGKGGEAARRKGDGSLFPALADKPPVPPLAEKTPVPFFSETTAPADADPLAEHLRALQAKVPEGFTVVPEPPFVVIGDEEPAMVRRRAEQTVRWAVERLKALYFEKDPPQILDIWLFKDKTSYERHVRELFGEEPTTPFGYCSPEHGALIMNIATGGGTLVHEIVHPFVAANFPACPAWFNEGLGSLYEQSAERQGRIVGLTNWRLKGLQETIRAGRVPSFQSLTATSDRAFYTEDKETNYAQARYLCYWLQEHGLLVKFYHAFRAAAKEDPTGYETLKRVLGGADMAAFQKRWEQFVLRLHFP